MQKGEKLLTLRLIFEPMQNEFPSVLARENGEDETDLYLRLPGLHFQFSFRFIKLVLQK